VTLPSPSPAIEKVYISADSLLRDSMELAMRIVRSGFKPTFLVAIWRGGAPIGIAVQETLEYHGIHADHIAIRTSAYTGIDQQSKAVRVHALDYLVSRLSYEDELLIIDDVFDSGRSLEAVVDELKRRCRRNLPDKIRIATAYYKPLARLPARGPGPDARGDPGEQAGRRELLRQIGRRARRTWHAYAPFARVRIFCSQASFSAAGRKDASIELPASWAMSPLDRPSARHTAR
jgi:hypoxanthine phosphoribosyltransferase